MISNISTIVSMSEEVHGGHHLQAMSATLREQEWRIEVHDRQLRSKIVVVFGMKEDECDGVTHF